MEFPMTSPFSARGGRPCVRLLPHDLRSRAHEGRGGERDHRKMMNLSSCDDIPLLVDVYLIIYWLVLWNMNFICPFSWECHNPN